MNTKMRIVLLAGCVGLVAAGTAHSSCPQNMPLQLIEDCIVIEGAGASFPGEDYPYIAEYKEWFASEAVKVMPAAGSSKNTLAKTEK